MSVSFKQIKEKIKGYSVLKYSTTYSELSGVDYLNNSLSGVNDLKKSLSGVDYFNNSLSGVDYFNNSLLLIILNKV